MEDADLQQEVTIKVRRRRAKSAESLDRVFADFWYSRFYRDRLDGAEPLQHYMEKGWRDGLSPNPIFDPKWYFDTQMKGLQFSNPLVHYCETGAAQSLPFNMVVDPVFLEKEHGDAVDTSVLRFLLVNEDVDFISPWFSRSLYLKANPDLIDWDKFAEMQYISGGYKRGRWVRAGVRAELKGGRAIHRPRGAGVYEKIIGEFTSLEGTYSVVEKIVSEKIRRQIAGQAQIDPDVTSVGHLAFGALAQFTATEINRRNLIDYRGLLRAIPVECDAIVILPAIHLGGAERYAANLAWGLQRAGLKCAFLTTDSSAEQDRANLSLGIFAKIGGLHVASLRDMLGGSWQKDTILALMLQRTKAKYLFVVNSDLGLRVARDYGKALSTMMHIYCAFFSESPNAAGAPYSVRYLTEILPIGKALSDNRAAVDKWRTRYNGVFADRFEIVPTLIDGVSHRVFAATAKAIVQRREEKQESLLWFSRWEKFKAVDVLMALADERSDTVISAFGSVDPSFDRTQLPANLQHHGVMSDINDLQIDDFGIFVFTSYFEGLPNTVLEMAYRGIPVVASDVGGLRETFGNDEIEFVNMDGSPEEIAERFSLAIERIWSLNDEDLLSRLEAARQAVERRHGTRQFFDNVARIAGRS